MLKQLNRLYDQYNRREYVHPDPIEFLYSYSDRKDREIAGLIASCLAYGRVRQILKSVAIVLDKMGESPHGYLTKTSENEIRSTYEDFVHRFAKGPDLSALLVSIKRNIETFGSIYRCFLDGFSQEDENVLPALIRFAKRINPPSGICCCGHLVPAPEKKSACKRLNLYLRWMARNDAVDPGGWDDISPSKLIIPLDVHMFRFCRAMNLTSRTQADMQAAIEITERFKEWMPDDPVRFDFALTRFGIRDDLNFMEVFGLL